MPKHSLISRGTAPLKVGASRAKELLEKLLRSRLRGGLFDAGPKGGALETFQEKLQFLEHHAAVYDLPVDFGFLRERLEALLAVLLELEDDRLVGDAVSGLQDEIEARLPRAEALFGSTRYVAAALADHADSEVDRVEFKRLLASRTFDERLLRWAARPSALALDEATLVGKGFLRLRDSGWTYFGLPIRWEEIEREDEPHGLGEVALVARAFASTGSASLAREAIGHMLDWAARSRGPRDGTARSAWRIRPSADRLLHLTESALTLMNSSEFTPEVAHVASGLALETARHLSGSIKPDDPGDALEMAGAALVAAGSIFDLFAESAEWREKGRGLLQAGPSRPASDKRLDALVFAALASGDEGLLRIARSAAVSLEGGIFADGRFAGSPQESERRAEDRLESLALARELLGEAVTAAGEHSFRFGTASGKMIVDPAAGGAHFAAGPNEALAITGPGPAETELAAGSFLRLAGAGGRLDLMAVEGRYVVASSDSGRIEFSLLAPICGVSADRRQFDISDGDTGIIVALSAPTDAAFDFQEDPNGRRAVASLKKAGRLCALVLPFESERPGVQVERLPDGLEGAMVRFDDRDEAVVLPGLADAVFAGISVGRAAAIFRRQSEGAWERVVETKTEGLDSRELPR